MKILRITLGSTIACLLMLFCIDRLIVASVAPEIVSNVSDVREKEVILVLGAQVYGRQVSQILAERLNAAIELQSAQKASIILVSGDYSGKYYDEAAAMRTYLEKHGVSGGSILEDHAGFSTYDSLYRALHVFGVRSLIVVSQDFHLPRALFIARSLGIDAVAFNASRVPLSEKEQFRTQWREPLARMKAVYDVVAGSSPAFTGSGLPFNAQGALQRW